MSLFTSCDDYDDTELWNKVNGLEERIAALEEWQKTTDNNLNALQTLINTMDYITSVAPIMQANDTIGYTINFHQSNPISIYNGTTSQIGITQDEEGNWLWTLDGEILTTPDGTPIPANGQDAAAPQLSTGKALQDEGIKTDAAGDAIIADIAYLSVDEGETWYRVTGEKGEQGDKGNTGSTGATGPAGANGDSFFESFFENVDYTSSDDYVIFTLANNGGTFQVAKYKGTLAFLLNGTPLTDLTQTIDLVNGNLTYTPADAEVSARIIDGEGWSASAENGTITVNVGQLGEEATLEVALTDNGRVVETYRLTIIQNGFKGAGTADAPYLISSAVELLYISKQMNESYSTTGAGYYTKYFKQTADIDLPAVAEGESNWIPLGKNADDEYFWGNYDGDGHVIRGMVINLPNTFHVGMFGVVASTSIGTDASTTIKNVTLESPRIIGKQSVGAIIGWSYAATIENCHVTGDAAIYGGNNVGGVVGDNGGLTRACSFSGTVCSGANAGGIAGYLSGGSKQIVACYATGEVIGDDEWHSVSIYGNNEGVGGVVGSLGNASSVVGCYSTAKVSSNREESKIGGVIGLQVGTVTVSTCYWGLSAGQTTPQFGIGSASSNDNATKVDGTTTTWETAKSTMNAALTGTAWQYAENTDGATKASLPLILVSSQAGQ